MDRGGTGEAIDNIELLPVEIKGKSFTKGTLFCLLSLHFLCFAKFCSRLT